MIYDGKNVLRIYLVSYELKVKLVANYLFYSDEF